LLWLCLKIEDAPKSSKILISMIDIRERFVVWMPNLETYGPDMNGLTSSLKHLLHWLLRNFLMLRTFQALLLTAEPKTEPHSVHNFLSPKQHLYGWQYNYGYQFCSIITAWKSPRAIHLIYCDQ
jgi:hypothetical protein